MMWLVVGALATCRSALSAWPKDDMFGWGLALMVASWVLYDATGWRP